MLYMLCEIHVLLIRNRLSRPDKILWASVYNCKNIQDQLILDIHRGIQKIPTQRNHCSKIVLIYPLHLISFHLSRTLLQLWTIAHKMQVKIRPSCTLFWTYASDCRTITGWPRSYRKYILQTTQPSQYRYAKLKYIFAVTSGSPSI